MRQRRWARLAAMHSGKAGGHLGATQAAQCTLSFCLFVSPSVSPLQHAATHHLRPVGCMLRSVAAPRSPALQGQPQRAGRSRAARCARNRLQRSPKQLITVVSAAAESSSDADPVPEFRPALQPGAAAVPPVAALAPQSGGLVIPHGREVEGLACLLLVSFLWGSYGPALR